MRPITKVDVFHGVDRILERLRMVQRIDRPLAGRDRTLAGKVGGWLWIVAGVATLALPLFQQVDPHKYPLWLAAIVALGTVAWGILATFVIPWERVPDSGANVATVAALIAISLITLRTGGTMAPARLYLFFVLIYAACFLPPWVALSAAAGSAVAWVLPIIGERGLGPAAAELAMDLPIFVILTGIILAGRYMLTDHQHAAEQLSDEHQALRIIATTVAAGLPPEQVFIAAARQAARLLQADAASIFRFEPENRFTLVGSWTGLDRESPVGEVFDIIPDGELAATRRTGHARRTDDFGDRTDGQAVELRARGYHSWVGTPVHVRGHLWGVIAVMSCVPHGLPEDAENHLAEFAELVAMAVANTEEVARLSADAMTDPLTGLDNHRAFQERLRAELHRACRHGHGLTLALVDLDAFKAVNDAGGHAVGDEVLCTVADALAAELRGGDTLARLGGDEFAVLLPETPADEAAAILERARQTVDASALPAGAHVTISVGLCDVSHAADAEQLTRLADGALYWSKEHGRNRVSVYDPETVRELSAAQRLAELQRSQAMVGIRALARAIDARDPSTSRHSERVAALTARLAEYRGWSAERVARLHEAALVHDVGKIGIPDAILLKPERLTREEYEIIKTHAELSARIVEDVLDAEQVEWILSHHERPDGGGYPRGLTAAELSEGAGLMAAADAFDVMVSARPYSPERSLADALAEVRSLAGRQFTPEAVEALEGIHASELAAAA